MKKMLAVILTVSLTVCISLCISSVFENSSAVSGVNKNAKANLVIDAGHGGIDAGTVGVDGALEKEINLSIALNLYDFARASGINSRLVRDGDYLVYAENDDKKRSDLYNRMNFINGIEKAVMISIHQNHFEDEKEWGAQIWYSPNDPSSKILADGILSVINDNLQKNNTRENKKSDSSYYLLYKARVPSVMVECGFMSNTAENKMLQDSAYQKKTAYSIMLGYADFLTKEL